MPTVTALEMVTGELRHLDEALTRALRLRDPERLLADYYATDARLFVHGHPAAEGTRAILDAWHHLYRSGLIDLRLELHRIDAEHDLAYSDGFCVSTFETHPALLRTTHRPCLTVYHRQLSGLWRVTAQALDLDLPNSVP